MGLKHFKPLLMGAKRYRSSMWGREDIVGLLAITAVSAPRMPLHNSLNHILVLFLVCRLFLCRGQFKRSLLPIPSVPEAVALLASYAVYCGTYKTIVRSVELGLPHAFATDLFVVACGAQVVGGIHPHGWWLWVLVPLYGIYLLIRNILTWVFTPDGPVPGSAAEAAAQRNREKKERKMRTGRIQLVR